MSALGILTAAERDLVLHTFNKVEVAHSGLLHPEQTLHGLLEHWAQATPQAISAVFEVRPCCRACVLMPDSELGRAWLVEY